MKMLIIIVSLALTLLTGCGGGSWDYAPAASPSGFIRSDFQQEQRLRDIENRQQQMEWDLKCRNDAEQRARQWNNYPSASPFPSWR